jgi:hypothetical protein
MIIWKTQFLIVSYNIYFLHIDFEGGKVVGIFTIYPLSVSCDRGHLGYR